MMFDNKITFRKSVLAILALDLLSFLFFYLFGFLIEGEIPGYIAGFSNLLLSTAIPTVSAVCMLFFYRQKGLKSALLKLCPLVLLRLVYLIPSNYVYYMNLHYDTGEALLLTALRSFIVLMLIYLEVTLLFLLIVFMLKKFDRSYLQSLDVELTADRVFDFSSRLTLAIFISTLPRFVLNLLREIISVVEYLVDYSGTYRAGEIIYMLFSLIFILAVTFITHFSAMKIKVYVARCSLVEDTQDL